MSPVNVSKFTHSTCPKNFQPEFVTMDWYSAMVSFDMSAYRPYFVSQMEPVLNDSFPKPMRHLLLISLFLTCVSTARTQLGDGLVSILFDEQTVLRFYADTLDQEPTQTLEFFDDSEINGITILELEAHKSWLQPEVIWLDYHILLFRSVKQSNSWLEVITNQTNGEKHWLKRSPTITFQPWEDFLLHALIISRRPEYQQEIRLLPNDQSEKGFYYGDDCFEVLSVKGDWMEISTAEYCELLYDNPPPFITGWIRWRMGNTLLIDYFLAL